MLALDVLLLLMIGVCIVYCWVLNQRIKDLHNSRIEFARMIKEFDAAVIKAEHCISDLSLLGKNATDQVKKAADTAEEVIEELKTIYTIGDKVGTKLESAIMEARKQQKALETASKSKKTQYKIEEEYIEDEDQAEGDANFAYEETESEDFAKSEYISDSEIPEHRNLLEKVLSKITTHKHKGTIDQNSYYDTLRKVSARK
jgi:Rps23 Pro-64 3,4-dihydroxylase Tpa1-like proline 4-hydroxylase